MTGDVRNTPPMTLALHPGDRVTVRDRTWRVTKTFPLDAEAKGVELHAVDEELPRRPAVVVPPDEVTPLPRHLMDANRAVAGAYGLDPDDFEHILGSFEGMARKRPELVAHLRERPAEWKAER